MKDYQIGGLTAEKTNGRGAYWGDFKNVRNSNGGFLYRIEVKESSGKGVDGELGLFSYSEIVDLEIEISGAMMADLILEEPGEYWWTPDGWERFGKRFLEVAKNIPGVKVELRKAEVLENVKAITRWELCVEKDGFIIQDF